MIYKLHARIKASELSRFVKLLLYLLSFKHFEHFLIFIYIYEGCQVHAKWMPSRGGTWQILAARPLWWPATAPIFGSPEKRSETKRHNAKRSCWCWPCWKSIEQHVGQLDNMSKNKIGCNKMEMIWDQASSRSWIFTEYSGIIILVLSSITKYMCIENHWDIIPKNMPEHRPK